MVIEIRTGFPTESAHLVSGAASCFSTALLGRAWTWMWTFLCSPAFCARVFPGSRRGSLPGVRVLPLPRGCPWASQRPRITLQCTPGRDLRVFVSLNWSTEGVRASGEVPSCSGQQRVAPVVMRVLAAPVGRGWPPGQGRVWIRKLFPTLEAEQRKPRAHAECNSGPGLWVWGGLGGLTSVLLKGSSGV